MYLTNQSKVCVCHCHNALVLVQERQAGYIMFKHDFFEISAPTMFLSTKVPVSDCSWTSVLSYFPC